MKTWKDLHQAMCDAGFDDDEYCGVSSDLADGQPVWTDETRDVVVWASPGGNEGYYAHIDSLGIDGKRRTCILAKFWDFDRALECVQWTTKAVYRDCEY